MRKAMAILLALTLFAAPASALSLKDILKGTQERALDLFVTQVMPVDGWAKVEKGEALVIRGQMFWNPDYYVVFRGGKVKFWGPIPTDVDVGVEVYKVYFGIFAVPYGDYQDIWWKKGRAGSGWVGAFFVSGFEWKLLGGESDVRYAWMAYNSPDIEDLASEDLNLNLTVQGSPGLKVELVDWDGISKTGVGDMYILWRG